MMGCGNIAGSIADDFEGGRGTTLGGASGIVAKNAQEITTEYGIQERHTDHEEILTEVASHIAIVPTGASDREMAPYRFHLPIDRYLSL
jgi:predicted dehydrogenase